MGAILVAPSVYLNEIQALAQRAEEAYDVDCTSIDV